MFIFHLSDTIPRTKLGIWTYRSRILWSGLVSIKIIIAGREAFLSNIKNRFGSGSAATASYRRLVYTLPHFVFACLNEIASNWLYVRKNCICDREQSIMAYSKLDNSFDNSNRTSTIIITKIYWKTKFNEISKQYNIIFNCNVNIKNFYG